MSFYDDLGVQRNASPEDIRRSYKILASKHHPDRKHGDTVKFQIVQKAYDTLSDPAKRKRYDTHGEEPAGPSPREKAMQQVASMVYRAIDHEDIDRVDLVEVVKAQVRDAMSKIPDGVTVLEKKIAKLERAKKRIVKKKGDQNMIAAMIDTQVKAHRLNVEFLNKEKVIGAEMIKILDEYKYDNAFAGWQQLGGTALDQYL